MTLFTCARCGLVIRSETRLKECVWAHYRHCRPQCVVCRRTVSHAEACWEVDNMGLGMVVHKACLADNLDLPAGCHPDRCLYLQWI